MSDDEREAIPGVDAYLGATIGGRYRLESMLRTAGWAAIDRAWFLARELEGVDPERLDPERLDPERRDPDGRGRELGVRVDRVIARPATIERRMRIALAAARLDHRGLERVEAWGALEDRVWWIAGAELLGGTLREHLEAEGGVLPVRESAAILGRAIEALEALHRAGLLHGDLELERVFLARGGRVVITEIGDNARLSGEELAWVPARPEVIAPEEARGRADEIGPRTEVYRVGAMLYELVTGVPPYGGRNAAATLHAILRAELEPPSRFAAIPPALESVIRRAMARAPEARFASMAELGAALAPFAGPSPGA